VQSTASSNAIMERWVRICRRELLDRTLIWNQRHLLRALREFEAFYNTHRPHQGIANACPLRPLSPITDPDEIAHLDTSDDNNVWAGSSMNIGMPPELRG
jgi:transposase InsO family protein